MAGEVISVNKPMFSVVVPVYNVEKYLGECVDSLLNQTFTDFEILLIDDGSTDSSGEICDRYAHSDSRVKAFHFENEGLGAARNKGFGKAVGEYVIFLDSDDFYDTNTLEILYSNLSENKPDVLIFSGKPFFDGINSDIKTLSYIHTVGLNEVIDGKAFLDKAIKSEEFYPQVCMYVYQRDFLVSSGIAFDEGVIHEDEQYSFLLLMRAKKVLCIPDRLYNRRYRTGSIMTSKSYDRSAYGYAAALNRILDSYIKNKSGIGDLEKQLYLQRISFLLTHIKLLYRCAWMDRVKKDGVYEYKLIDRQTKPIRLLVRQIKGDLKFRSRLLLYNLHLGAVISLVTEKIRGES